MCKHVTLRVCMSLIHGFVSYGHFQTTDLLCTHLKFLIDIHTCIYIPTPFQKLHSPITYCLTPSPYL